MSWVVSLIEVDVVVVVSNVQASRDQKSIENKQKRECAQEVCVANRHFGMRVVA